MTTQEESEVKYEILPEDYTQYDLSFKIIVIGDSGVGKTCLSNKATKNTFDDSYNTTIGFEFFSFNIKMFEKVIKLQVWDTCGQELYRSLITNFYRNASLAIMVYAINNKDSFDNIDVWLKELKIHSNPDSKAFLIGNKIDLENERKVNREQGEEYSNQNNFSLFMESSAKTGFNAQKIFIEAARILYNNYLKYNNQIDDKTSIFKPLKNDENNKLSSSNTKNKNGGCC